MPKVTRVVCQSCGANWFAAPKGTCPSCNGPVKEMQVDLMPDGTIKVPA